MVTGECVAIIPARGGSKRLKRKNVVDFCGKPMLAWTVEAALKSGKFSRVVVSTDDTEIAEVGRQFGASVPFLREGHSGDHASVSMATIGTLHQLRDGLGERYEVVVQLMANCPLRDEHHIIQSLEHFKKCGATCQISCFKFGWMNPWWAVTLSDEGRPHRLFADALDKRSQDLPAVYCPSGAIWISKAKDLEQNGSFYGPGHIFWPMPWSAAVDIDDQEDLRMAESLYRMRQDPRSETQTRFK